MKDMKLHPISVEIVLSVLIGAFVEFVGIMLH